MGEVTLKVPGEHVEAFRLAAAAEVRMHGEWVANDATELSGRLVRSDERDGEQLADIHGAATCMDEVIAILDQLFPWPSGREVRGGAYALAHITEAMVNEVIAPAIASEARVSPIDERALAKLDSLRDGLTWAAGEAKRLHSIAADEPRETEYMRTV
jgi:hypothetical protein